MTAYILTVINTTGIQDYIFGSNNLKHNVGASHLVHKATHDWVYDALDTVGSNNITADGERDDSRRIEAGELDAELLYSGGGNTFIIFRAQESAQQFTRRLTRRVLCDAPGLQLVVAHEKFDWNSEPPLSEIANRAAQSLRTRKMDRRRSAPQLGLGVTADCQFTGLPAVGRDPWENQRISAEVLAKLRAAGAAHNALIRELPLSSKYGIPKDFDDFGRTEGESSYIAVVHTDGNGMGKRIEAIAQQYTSPDQNREYVQGMREFSDAIRETANDALTKTTQALINAIDSDEEQLAYRDITIALQKDDDGRLMIPFRPIVFGGDDVTFVCDGRLGLTLTEYYLRKFTENPLPFDDESPYARAGIAVVTTHYPFARAYQLAEALTKRAKDYIIEQTDGEKNLTAIDWHFAVNGFVRDLSEIRDREYKVPAGDLLMRPLHLSPPTITDWRSWHVFTDLVEGFSDPNRNWAGRRNKLKALREVLRDGPSEVQQFLRAFRLRLPKVMEEIQPVEGGWKGDRCVYYDAVEALDFFVALEGASE